MNSILGKDHSSDAMNDVANTVEYILDAKENE